MDANYSLSESESDKNCRIFRKNCHHFRRFSNVKDWKALKTAQQGVLQCILCVVIRCDVMCVRCDVLRYKTSCGYTIF